MKPKVGDLLAKTDDDRALDARILGDLADRRFERPEYDVDAGLHVVGLDELADGRLGSQQRNATSWNDAFLELHA